MRRLPIFFLIDVSESMVGEQIQLVEEGMANIIKELKTDPYALETVWISIIVFAGQARTVIPLQEIVSFYPPRFPVGSGTSLSKGLGHLMYELRTQVKQTTLEVKGDWKPIVFLFTDGVPTDQPSAAIAEWKRNWERTANLVAVSFGDESNVHLLKQLTDHVLLFKNTDISAYKEFFKWVTDSIKTNSESVDKNQSGFELASFKPDLLSKIDLAKTTQENQYVDSEYVILLAKCAQAKRPYLMKYKKTLSESGFYDLQTVAYRLNGAFPVDQTYFELSEEIPVHQKINSEELIGSPTCPCCGNQIGFAACACGGLHCISGEGEATCPWCNQSSYYGYGSDSFDINRSQG